METTVLTESGRKFLGHTAMWGFPVQKLGRHWHWADLCGVKGAPTAYKTKRQALDAVHRYIAVLLDRQADAVAP